MRNGHPRPRMRADLISRPEGCKRAEISRLFRPRCGARVRPDRDSDRGYVIDHDDAMEPPDIGLLVPFACPVQGATIVRHQHVARLPAMAVAEAVLDHVL